MEPIPGSLRGKTHEKREEPVPGGEKVLKSILDQDKWEGGGRERFKKEESKIKPGGKNTYETCGEA